MELLHEACQFEYSQDNDPKKSRLFAKAVNQLVKDFGLERYRLPLHPHDQLEQAVGLLFKSGCVAQTLAAKQFLEIVDKLNRAGHAIDVHMGNVMIRRPPRRMEVVITDPLA